MERLATAFRDRAQPQIKWLYTPRPLLLQWRTHIARSRAQLRHFIYQAIIGKEPRPTGLQTLQIHLNSQTRALSQMHPAQLLTASCPQQWTLKTNYLPYLRSRVKDLFPAKQPTQVTLLLRQSLLHQSLYQLYRDMLHRMLQRQ